jgi:hypothetical protein
MRIVELIEDETGDLSSTRVVGLACGFALVAMALAQAFSPLVVEVNERLVEALEYTTIACLLWAQIGKFSKKDLAGD